MWQRTAVAIQILPGLFCEVRIRHADGTEQTIGTDASWEWTARAPNPRGRYAKGKEPDDWRPVAVIPDPAVWSNRVGSQLLAALTNASNSPPRMVRASLVKGDALMRALGRPNRDQIVSMRPTELTTLEAIDLANGPILADVIERGATKLVAAHGSDSAAFAGWLYRFALSRPPTSNELAVAVEILGATLSEQSIADLVWSVCMFPEFQLVR